MSEHPEYIRGVKDCIAALPQVHYVTSGQYNSTWGYNASCRLALEALLPKPDHAKAAVEAWWRSLECCSRDPKEAAAYFARWLEHQGVDLSRWGE